jgi:hypothetical protein
MASRDELYAKFGLTAEAAQLFETELGTILLAFEGEQQNWHLSPDRERGAEFLETINRKTLGQLLKALSDYMDLDDEVTLLFNDALQARNRLNHGFFEHHNFAIQTDEGRNVMIADLERLHQQLFAAWQIAQRASDVLLQRLKEAQSRR